MEADAVREEGVGVTVTGGLHNLFLDDQENGNASGRKWNRG